MHVTAIRPTRIGCQCGDGLFWISLFVNLDKSSHVLHIGKGETIFVWVAGPLQGMMVSKDSSRMKISVKEGSM